MLSRHPLEKTWNLKINLKLIRRMKVVTPEFSPRSIKRAIILSSKHTIIYQTQIPEEAHPLLITPSKKP